MTGIIADVVVILLLVIIVGSSLLYIRKEKKRGVHCIGCPSAGSCTRSCASKPKQKKKD